MTKVAVVLLKLFSWWVIQLLLTYFFVSLLDRHALKTFAVKAIVSYLNVIVGAAPIQHLLPLAAGFMAVFVIVWLAKLLNDILWEKLEKIWNYPA